MLVASTTGPSAAQGGVLDLTAARIVSVCTTARVPLGPLPRPSAAADYAAAAQMAGAVKTKGKVASS